MLNSSSHIYSCLFIAFKSYYLHNLSMRYLIMFMLFNVRYQIILYLLILKDYL